MNTFKRGDRAIFFKGFLGYPSKGQEVEFVCDTRYQSQDEMYGGFKFVNKDGGSHNLDGALEGEWEAFGLYIPYSCVELIAGQLEND